MGIVFCEKNVLRFSGQKEPTWALKKKVLNLIKNSSADLHEVTVAYRIKQLFWEESYFEVFASKQCTR